MLGRRKIDEEGTDLDRREAGQLDRVVERRFPVGAARSRVSSPGAPDVDLVLALGVGALRRAKRSRGWVASWPSTGPAANSNSIAPDPTHPSNRLIAPRPVSFRSAATTPSITSETMRKPTRESSTGAAGRLSAGTTTSPITPTSSSRRKMPAAQIPRSARCRRGHRHQPDRTLEHQRDAEREPPSGRQASGTKGPTAAASVASSVVAARYRRAPVTAGPDCPCSDCESASTASRRTQEGAEDREQPRCRPCGRPTARSRRTPGW